MLFVMFTIICGRDFFGTFCGASERDRLGIVFLEILKFTSCKLIKMIASKLHHICVADPVVLPAPNYHHGWHIVVMCLSVLQVLAIAALVKGLVVAPVANHESSVERSYTWPSCARTGSAMTSHDIGHRTMLGSSTGCFSAASLQALLFRTSITDDLMG